MTTPPKSGKGDETGTQRAVPGVAARAVSAEVRAAMGRHRVSGLQLAGLVGMSQNYLAKRLRDDAPFTINDVERICAVLGEDLLELMTAAAAHFGNGNGNGASDR